MTPTISKRIHTRISGNNSIVGSDDERSYLSGYATPDKVLFELDSNGQLLAVQLKYPGSEDSGETCLLDNLDNPSVTLHTSKYTNRIEWMKLSGAVPESEFDVISARLRSHSNNQSHPIGRRLSCLLISEILHDQFKRAAGV